MCYGTCRYELYHSGECGLRSEGIPEDAACMVDGDEEAVHSAEVIKDGKNKGK